MKQLLCVLVAAVLVGSLAGCGENLIPGNGPQVAADSAGWFEGIYLDLLDRQEKGPMGQMANCKYVCDAINQFLEEQVITPVLGTELQIANCEYLLKTIDQVNSGATSYGTSQYATQQVIDDVAVAAVLKLIDIAPTGLFILMGIAGSATSKDSSTWKAGDGSGQGYRVCYGNKAFISVGKDYGHAGVANKVWSSGNGLSWAENPTPINAEWYDVGYFNGIYIAVRHQADALSATDLCQTIITSIDGRNWESTTLPPFQVQQGSSCFLKTEDTMQGVAYNGEVFVAVGNSLFIDRLFFENGVYDWEYTYTKGILYSIDGKNWIRIRGGNPNTLQLHWNTVRYLNGRFIAVGQNSYHADDDLNYNWVAISTDGITWTYQKIQTSQGFSRSWEGIRQISYGNGRYVAVGDDNFRAYSTDGINWTVVTYTSPGSRYPIWTDVIFANGKFITIDNNTSYGPDTPLMGISEDGINWVDVPAPLNRNWNAIDYSS